MLTRIWLTFKQHRFETLAISIVCVGLTAAAFIEAYRLNSLNVPMSCFNSWRGNYLDPSGPPIDAATAHCNSLVNSFMSLQAGVDMNLVRLLLMFAPLLVGILFGAPLVARELEQGTAPLSWALSGSRRRWLLGKVLTGVLLIVPLMLAVGLAADALEGARDPGLNPYAAFENYLDRGVIVVFWALAAFAGTVALGTMMGRTLPALIVALVVCFFVRAGWDAGMTRFVLSPFAVQQPARDLMAQSTWYSGQVDMTIYYQTYLDGKPWDGDVQAWYQEHGPIGPTGAIGVDTGSIDQSQVPTSVAFVIPGTWYWRVVALESGMLLAGSVFCGAIAFTWVDRRRPY
jgi:ABC-type transport system involved in multi-copper enzyme maturation permease subunit